MFLFHLEKKKKPAWNDSSSCLIAWKKRLDGSGGFITWRNNRQADKDVCDICIYFAKQIIKCSTFTTCSQLICPKHAIPFYIPQPLQLKKKNTLLLQVLSLLPLLSGSPLFSPLSCHQLISDMQSPFYLFLVSGLAVPQCTLLKCIFPNHSSKANCLPREPEPCPMLQEITVRLSRTR